MNRYGTANPAYKDGRCQTKTYRHYQAIVGRCCVPGNAAWLKYGAIGIKLCAHWRGSDGSDGYSNFLRDVGALPDDKDSIDRFPDNKGNYSCGHCEDCITNGWKFNARWATFTEQQRNQTVTKRYLHDGKNLTLMEWSEETGIDYIRLYHRINKFGWTIEEAITPVDRAGPSEIHSMRYLFNGDRLTLVQIAKKSGQLYNTLAKRVARGCSIEEATAIPYIRRKLRK